MKNRTSLLLLATLLAAPALLASCSDNENEPAPQSPTTSTVTPNGNVSTLKTGTITPQNGTPTTGMLTIVRDANNREFVQLADDFKSDFHTGTVTIYLAKATTNIGVQRRADAGSVKVVGLVNKNGKQVFLIDRGLEAFSTVVFYCETAAINFGAAPLQ
ncbi:DM13 domain-containing protein [Hymenobacter algoricola]|uniref:DM13 domain-containing protein n=1 Tax=Hymenobacter algoricola TaxID=486267 RepID=A0ABP7NFB2_9BACT